MILLSAEEKNKSNGYDAIVSCWSKVVIWGKEKKKIVERLSSWEKKPGILEMKIFIIKIFQTTITILPGLVYFTMI